MTDDFLFSCIFGLAWLLILPTLLIAVGSWVVSLLVKNSFRTHAAFGLLGVPVHELSHALFCLVFRMPITKIKLYSPNLKTGILGYVAFAYNPSSLGHAVGLLFQGVAPLIVCCLILNLLIPLPEQGFTYLDVKGEWFLSALTEGVNNALGLTVGNIASGWEGATWACLALLIAAYAIPSWTDVRVALRGAVVVALMFIAACAFLTVAGEITPEAFRGDVIAYLELVQSSIMAGLYSLISSVSQVAAVSLIGIVCIQITPAVAGLLIKKVFRH
ncbi:hypothetical protein ABGT16_04640 [Pseudomonas asiatica]|uniref:hypothetical protein n=1 Tax=Pseudomonas asiatica TaxID=2219225 RepID=UPI00345CA6F3